jgi:tRNA threonylcarbamoyladenosine biosynthesis protein TsaE
MKKKQKLLKKQSRMSKTRDFSLFSPEETHLFGKKIASSLEPNTVIALSGDLGAGKTTLIKGIVEGLSGNPLQVQSPTFVYLHIYSAKFSIYHFDVYRLKNSEQFLALGFEEYFSAGGICLIEWSEKITSILPPNTSFIHLSHEQNFNERTLSLTGKVFPCFINDGFINDSAISPVLDKALDKTLDGNLDRNRSQVKNFIKNLTGKL